MPLSFAQPKKLPNDNVLITMPRLVGTAAAHKEALAAIGGHWDYPQ